MTSFYSILIDLGVLAFFGLLFYYFQRRRIIKHSKYEIRELLQKFIFDLHVYLDDKQRESDYKKLNQYAEDLEKLLPREDILNLKDQLTPPKELPENMQREIEQIIQLF